MAPPRTTPSRRMLCASRRARARRPGRASGTSRAPGRCGNGVPREPRALVAGVVENEGHDEPHAPGGTPWRAGRRARPLFRSAGRCPRGRTRCGRRRPERSGGRGRGRRRRRKVHDVVEALPQPSEVADLSRCSSQLPPPATLRGGAPSCSHVRCSGSATHRSGSASAKAS